MNSLPYDLGWHHLHPIWREAAEALGISLAPSVSIARNQPFFSLGAPLANMLALIFSFIVCIDRDRARQLFLVVAWSGVAYAVYGIAAYLIDPNHVLWREKIAYRRCAYLYFHQSQYGGSVFRIMCRVVAAHSVAACPPASCRPDRFIGEAYCATS